MKDSFKKGIGFGFTSGIITTLGLLTGLNSSTNSSSIVIGGLIVIAVADALSDSLGIHISEEAKTGVSTREVWEATLSALISKFLVASSFLIPLFVLDLFPAMIVSLVWGFILLVLISYKIASDTKVKAWKVIGEHVGIATLVVVITHLIGSLVDSHLN